MPSSAPTQPLATPDPAGLVEVLLNVSLTSTLLLRPSYDGEVIVDFAWERLNAAAQQQLHLPECPAESLLTLFPSAAKNGVFQFYRDTFLSSQLERRQNLYQYEGRPGYYLLAAQRHGQWLVVNFSDSNDHSRSAPEQELYQRQLQEVAARAESERQRVALQQMLELAPVLITVLRGPAYLIEVANATACHLWGRTREQALGTPLFELLPEIAAQGFEELLEQVRTTGQVQGAKEMPSTIYRYGRLDTVYWNFAYLPLPAEDGQVDGVLVVAVEVTEQVLARQQVQLLNEELASGNEELRTSNEEFLATNVALTTAQEELQQLNHKLEARVQERTSQLAEQQQLLHHILSQVPAAVATLGGPEHRFSFANAGYQRMVGREVVGKPVAEALPEVVEQGFIDLLNHVYTSGEPYVGREIAIMLEQPTGPAIQQYLDFTYQPLTDGKGVVQGILVFVVDVTEQVRTRRQAETLQSAMLAVAQRQAQERQDLYQIFEQTPVAIVLLREPQHRIDYFNPAFLDLFPPEQGHGPVKGHRVDEVYPRLKLAGLMTLLDRVYTTGEPQLVTDMPLAELQPGSPRYVTFAYQAYQEQDRIVGVAAFVYDVTEQVLAKQERENQQRIVATVFEQSPVAIWVVQGPEYVFELLNPLMGQLLGRPPEQALGRPYFEVMPELVSQGLPELIRQAWQSSDPVYVQEMPVQLARHAPGEVGYFSFVFQSLRDEHGQIARIACVATDVTSQVVARQQVQALNKELAAINEELTATNEELHSSNTRLTHTNADLDTFVYSASHDLKSPITNIEGLLLALRQQLPAAALKVELVPKLLDMMDGAVRRFQQTLGHLTDVSRLQQTMFDQPAEAVDLPALVESVRLDMLPELTVAHATLAVALEDCPTVYFAAKTLRSILYNLLSNAVKYRAPDRPAQVQLRGYPAPNGQLVLAVQDNGLGLSQSQQSELFRLFRRLHTHVSGSGVGLYMVKKMVDNAGGTLAVQSELGVGSTFTVTLPAPKPALT